MENTRPDQGIKLVIRVVDTLTVDEEVEIVVTTNGVHVVVNIFDLFGLTKYLNIIHFLSSHFVESFDQLFSELEGKFILREVPKSLVEQPHVHVGNRVVDMEVVWYIHGIDKLPGVNIHQHPREKHIGLHDRPLLATLKVLLISEVSEPLAKPGSTLYILMSAHAVQCHVKIKGFEPRLGRGEVLLVIHSVVALVLIPI